MLLVQAAGTYLWDAALRCVTLLHVRSCALNHSSGINS